MSIKINPENGLLGDGVKKSQVKSLVNNFYSRMKKKKGTLSRELEFDKDSKCVWFTKEKLDELFKDNGCDETNNKLFGLRIYFCVHRKGILDDGSGHDIPDEYDNQQTVVLVATKNQDGKPDLDQLTDKSFIQIAGYSGDALNHGKLCPPEICDGSLIILP